MRNNFDLLTKFSRLDRRDLRLIVLMNICFLAMCSYAQTAPTSVSVYIEPIELESDSLDPMAEFVAGEDMNFKLAIGVNSLLDVDSLILKLDTVHAGGSLYNSTIPIDFNNLESLEEQSISISNDVLLVPIGVLPFFYPVYASAQFLFEDGNVSEIAHSEENP